MADGKGSMDPWAICHEPSALSHDPFLYSELDSPDAQRVAVGDVPLVHALAVDERAVRALQVDHFQFVGGGGDPAVQPRDERGVDDEILARGASDGLHGAGSQAKRGVGLGAPKNPHGATFYLRVSSLFCMARTTSRKRLYIGLGAAVVVLGGAAGLVTLKGAAPEIDPSKLATVERGTM